MSWSTCAWTLLSHNNPICVIASCVVPYQRPLRNSLWSNLSACVHHSQRHPGCWWYRAQTGPTRSRRTSDFGNHADSQQVCYLRLSACWCYWLIYLNAKVSQLLLKCYFLLFEPNIILHDIVINNSNDCHQNNMNIRPVRLTIADLQQEM